MSKENKYSINQKIRKGDYVLATYLRKLAEFLTSTQNLEHPHPQITKRNPFKKQEARFEVLRDLKISTRSDFYSLSWTHQTEYTNISPLSLNKRNPTERMNNTKQKRSFNNSKAKGNDKKKRDNGEFHLLFVYKEGIDYTREVVWSGKEEKQMKQEVNQERVKREGEIPFIYII